MIRSRQRQTSRTLPKAEHRSGHLAWSLLSLWALVALVMPSLAWACPMASRVMSVAASTPTSTSMHCPCEAATSAAATLTDAISGSGAMAKCCHKIPLPDSDTSGDHKSGALVLPQNGKSKVLPVLTTGHTLAAGVFALPPVAQYFAPDVLAIRLSSTSPPRFPAQLFPALHSGLSPPL